MMPGIIQPTLFHHRPNRHFTREELRPGENKKDLGVGSLHLGELQVKPRYPDY